MEVFRFKTLLTPWKILYQVINVSFLYREYNSLFINMHTVCFTNQQSKIGLTIKSMFIRSFIKLD
jgi:hypothetical protein